MNSMLCFEASSLTLGASNRCRHLLLTKRIVMNSEFPIWWSSEQESLPRHTVKSLPQPPLHRGGEKKAQIVFLLSKHMALTPFNWKQKHEIITKCKTVAQTEMKKKKKKKSVNCQYLCPINHLFICYPFKDLPLSHTQGKRLGKISQQYFTDVTHSRFFS